MTPIDPALSQYLARLQLPYFAQNYPDLAAEAARKQWPYPQYLEHLVAGEIARRDDALIARRLKHAHLPAGKTLDSFDWSWPKKINRAQIQHLFRLDFVPEHGNVIFLGGVGVGKTHLAAALAHTACRKGYTTLFTSAIDIVNTFAAAQAVGGAKRVMARLLKPSVVAIDELGYLPIDQFGADALFQVISQRYERGSTIITSNRAYKTWPQIFHNDSTLTSALLDRLLHHAETVVIDGRSYRMREQVED
jgi:DNA replication protein DnaC